MRARAWPARPGCAAVRNRMTRGYGLRASAQEIICSHTVSSC